MQQGQSAAAIRSFEMAVQMAPDNVEAHFNLAIANQIGDNPAKAIEQYRKILTLQPEHLDTLNNLAWLYATSPSPNRNTTEAVRLATQLCQATKHGDPSHLDTLAAALSEMGDFQQAVAIATAALKLARGRGESELEAKLTERAALYQSGQRVTDANSPRNRG
jgi:Tfp pilus assembly protein PilF